ncbi:MAG: CPBP family intramembrane metalloprotease [Pseudobutyrivibrio sp.]|nr:CPBP family intramembrane metalloprotease [Pseudobutyrivibrio sp.]
MTSKNANIRRIDAKKQYSEYLIIAYLTYMSLYIIFNSAIEFFYKSNPIYKIGNYLSLILAIGTLVPLVRKIPTDFLIEPLKVNKAKVWHALTKGLLLCLIFGGLMILIKFVILQLSPDMLRRCQPFFYFDRLMPGRITSNTMLYPLTAFWQEYCMNVMGYDGMRTLLVGNHRKHKSVSVVALFFGAMHYTYGFPMIIFTILFVLFMNYIYRRTKNLWVCMLVHLILGQLLFTLQLQKITFVL